MKKYPAGLCLFLAFMFLVETGLAETGSAKRYRELINTPLRDRNAAITYEHVWSEWKELLSVTEVSDGLRERVCSVCGKKQQEAIPHEAESTAAESSIPEDFVPDETWLIWRTEDEEGNVTERWAFPAVIGLQKTSVSLPDGTYAEAYTEDLYPGSDTVPDNERIGFVYNKAEVSYYTEYSNGRAHETKYENRIPGGTILFVLEALPPYLKVLYGNKVVYIGNKSLMYMNISKDQDPVKARVTNHPSNPEKAPLQVNTQNNGDHSVYVDLESVINVYGYEKKYVITEYGGKAGFIAEKHINYCTEKPEEGHKLRLYKDKTPFYSQPWTGSISDRLRKQGEYEIEDMFTTKEGADFYLFRIDERAYYVKAEDIELVPDEAAAEADGATADGLTVEEEEAK